jgi:hypothetical protein
MSSLLEDAVLVAEFLKLVEINLIGQDPMPRGLGISVSVRSSPFWLRWVVSDSGCAEGRRAVPVTAGTAGPEGGPEGFAVFPLVRRGCWQG